MNKYRKKHLIAIQLCSIVLLILAVAASGKAQTPASKPATDGRSDMRGTLAFVPRFRLSFGPSGLNVIPANSTRTNIVRRSSISPEALKAIIEMTLGGLKPPEANLQPASAGKAPLFTVAHDDSLQGDGTSQSPLGIKIPLNLNGSLSLSGSLTVDGDIRAKTITSGNSFVSGLLDVDGLIRAHTTSGNAVEATGGSAELGFGANAVKATGGNSQNLVGGIGVEAHGGQGRNGGAGLEAHGGQGTNSGIGGNGVVGFAGNSAIGLVGFGGGNDTGFAGGDGLLARGGHSTSFTGGKGAEIIGGDSDTGEGGAGLDVTGGDANGPGHQSGAGIVVRPGTPRNGASRGPAGQFAGDVNIDTKLFVRGDVEIRGNLVKASGSFKIDHPLDPENKYLSHSFVESPDMMNIYSGTVTTNAKAEGVVTLPDWFEALNQDFRYQLTVIGTFAQAIVAEEIKGNRFVVKTSTPNVKVSWQVTGVRHDAYANKHRIPVEEQKAEGERGLYLHPDAFNQPEERGVQSVRNAPRSKE